MTDPNSDVTEETLAAREIVKGWMTPAFANAIDRGELDPWGHMEHARAMLLKAPQIAEGEA